MILNCQTLAFVEVVMASIFRLNCTDKVTVEYTRKAGSARVQGYYFHILIFASTRMKGA